ncbi:MAG: hypothetical protein F4Y04_04880 [Chloroflexi bacterium]|nr:hypothetical protein [Chloroflexota bacterium]
MVKLCLIVAVVAVACAIFGMSALGQSTNQWLVESDADRGDGSLRWALERANDSPGDDRIRFASAMTIRPRSPLPQLTDAGITIDGSNGDASPQVRPGVWLDGSSAGDAAGLELMEPRATIRGLGIGGFHRYGIGVIGADARDATIEGNWIGLRADGRALANRLSGVAVIGGAQGARVINNRIGGNSVPQRTGHGIVVGGGGSVDAILSGNVLGIGADGSPLPNDDGILVVDSAQATIRQNTIGNSAVAGIELRETRLLVTIDANRIGIRSNGALAPNDVGIFLGPRSANAQIGATKANLIAGNRVGIAVEQGAREALIEDNWIGLVPRDGTLAISDAKLPNAIVRPNRERGISVIAGAAEIRLRNNYVAAGEFGIVVADPITTRVSLTRNVVAGARDGPTEAAIDVRAGTELTIGGEEGFGNHVCGAEFGIRLADTEEATVDSNAIGVSAATRVRFDSDARLLWAIRLDDGVVRARVRNNQIGDAERAGISVVGSASRDNALVGDVSSDSSLGQNQFSGNGLDIDLGGDGRTANDARDRDRGPNDLLNHPVILDHTIRKISDRIFHSTYSGTATPGSRVYIFERSGSSERRLTRSQPTRSSGKWTITIPGIPTGTVRALAKTSVGATSEFSPSFLPSQRLRLRPGANWIAWTGPPMSTEAAMSPLLLWIEAAWVWRSSDSRWQGWSPWAPPLAAGNQGSLQTLETGDVVRLQLSPQASGDFFVPAGGALDRLNVIQLKQGYNSVTWLAGNVDALETLSALDAAQPDLIGTVWQWDGHSWELIWPHLRGAWEPGPWMFPVLWIRAVRDGELSLP